MLLPVVNSSLERGGDDTSTLRAHGKQMFAQYKDHGVKK